MVVVASPQEEVSWDEEVDSESDFIFETEQGSKLARCGGMREVICDVAADDVGILGNFGAISESTGLDSAGPVEYICTVFRP